MEDNPWNDFKEKVDIDDELIKIPEMKIVDIKQEPLEGLERSSTMVHEGGKRVQKTHDEKIEELENMNKQMTIEIVSLKTELQKAQNYFAYIEENFDTFSETGTSKRPRIDDQGNFLSYQLNK